MPATKRRKRRTQIEMRRLKDAVLEIAEEIQPFSVRQMFYQLVSRGIIEKTEREYENVAVSLCKQLRLAGELPYEWVVDYSRRRQKPWTSRTVSEFLEDVVDSYTKSVWDGCPDYVEIWLEKEGLTGLFYDVTAKWDVTLCASKGFSSLSLIHQSSRVMNAHEGKVYIYQFGDQDPSGVAIFDKLRDDFTDVYCPTKEVIVERVAVLPQHIDAYDLPTRPTKKSDSRSKNFKGESVEIDALPPNVLRDMIETSIQNHLSPDHLDSIHKVQEAERLLIRDFFADAPPNFNNRWGHILDE